MGVSLYRLFVIMEMGSLELLLLLVRQFEQSVLDEEIVPASVEDETDRTEAKEGVLRIELSGHGCSDYALPALCQTIFQSCVCPLNNFLPSFF